LIHSLILVDDTSFVWGGQGKGRFAAPTFYISKKEDMLGVVRGELVEP
jgi:hypothetical protein